MIEDRTTHITDAVTDALTAIPRTTAVPVPLEVYRSYPTMPQFSYGLMSPLVVEDTTILVPFCPEMLAISGEEFDDDDFAGYVEMLEVIALMHVKYLLDDADGVARHQRIEEELAGSHGEQFRLVSAAQLHAVDQGLVRFDA